MSRNSRVHKDNLRALIIDQMKKIKREEQEKGEAAPRNQSAGGLTCQTREAEQKLENQEKNQNFFSQKELQTKRDLNEETKEGIGPKSQKEMEVIMEKEEELCSVPDELDYEPVDSEENLRRYFHDQDPSDIKMEKLNHFLDLEDQNMIKEAMTLEEEEESPLEAPVLSSNRCSLKVENGTSSLFQNAQNKNGNEIAKANLMSFIWEKEAENKERKKSKMVLKSIFGQGFQKQSCISMSSLEQEKKERKKKETSVFCSRGNFHSKMDSETEWLFDSSERQESDSDSEDTSKLHKSIDIPVEFESEDLYGEEPLDLAKTTKKLIIDCRMAFRRVSRLKIFLVETFFNVNRQLKKGKRLGSPFELSMHQSFIMISQINNIFSHHA